MQLYMASLKPVPLGWTVLCWAVGGALQGECECMAIKNTNRQLSKYKKDAQSYTLLIEHNGKSIYGIP